MSLADGDKHLKSPHTLRSHWDIRHYHSLFMTLLHAHGQQTHLLELDLVSVLNTKYHI